MLLTHVGDDLRILDGSFVVSPSRSKKKLPQRRPRRLPSDLFIHFWQFRKIAKSDYQPRHVCQPFCPHRRNRRQLNKFP